MSKEKNKLLEKRDKNLEKVYNATLEIFGLICLFGDADEEEFKNDIIRIEEVLLKNVEKRF